MTHNKNDFRWPLITDHRPLVLNALITMSLGWLPTGISGYQRAVGADLGVVASLHRAHDSNIAGTRIHNQQVRFVRGKRQRVRMVAD